MHKRYLLVASLAAVLGGCLVAAQPSGTVSQFEFGLMGDLPYTSEQDTQFLNVRDDINQSKLAFVVHDGDFKSGSTLCSDQTFNQRKQLFQTFVHPFIFIPGDNEWTDCHRENNGRRDPLERLAMLRKIFFGNNSEPGKANLKADAPERRAKVS